MYKKICAVIILAILFAIVLPFLLSLQFVIGEGNPTGNLDDGEYNDPTLATNYSQTTNNIKTKLTGNYTVKNKKVYLQYKSIIESAPSIVNNMPIDCTWTTSDSISFTLGNNLFASTVSGSSVEVSKNSERLNWNPTVIVNTKEYFALGLPKLLVIDPINANYLNNTLEWDYGVCIRRLRAIEGIIQETWIFSKDPGNTVCIKENKIQTSGFVWTLPPCAYDAIGTPLVIDDNKQVKMLEFKGKVYPITIDPTTEDYSSSASDGYCSKSSTVNYSVAWANVSGVASATGTTTRIGQSKVVTIFTVYRSFFYFNTTAVPDNAIISSANVSLYGQTDSSTQDFEITIQTGMPTWPHDPLVATDYEKGNYSGNGGFINTSAFSLAGYNNISLNASGISMINLSDWTKFCVRDDKDIAGTAPTTTTEYVYVYTSEQGVGFTPYLEIIYTLPPQYILTVDSDTYGNVSIPGEGNYTYWENTMANISAIANPCYYFFNWSGDTSEIVDVNAASTTINMSANWSIYANFVYNGSYYLNYSAGIHGSVTGNVSQIIDCGNSGTAITAIADPGYHFVQWNDSSIDNPRTDINISSNITVVAKFTMAGDGTAGNPYIIMNIVDFQEVDLDLTAYYEVGCNINASATIGWNGGSGFKPIWDYVSYFSGDLDGNGYIISNLYISLLVSGYAAPFTGISGTVENLNFADVYIAADLVAAGFCVENFGVITNCSVTGTLNCLTMVASGFCNTNYGLITKCYADCTVSGQYYVGGFVSFNNNLISDCYALGDVLGTDIVAGFCAAGGLGITNSYSSGHVTATGASLFGFDDIGSVDCFWDTDTSFIPAGGGGGTGKTTVEMMQEATFTNWDFLSPIWYIVEGWTYPTFIPMLCTPTIPTNPLALVVDYGWNISTINDTNTIHLSWNTGIGNTGTYIMVCEDVACNCSDRLTPPVGCSVIYNGSGTSMNFSGADLSIHSYYFTLWGYATCYGNTSYTATCEQVVVDRRSDYMFIAFVLLALGLMVIAFWQRKTWVFLLSGMSWIGFGAYGLINGSTGDVIWYFGWLGIAAGLIMFTAPTWLRDKFDPIAYEDEAAEYKAGVDKIYDDKD